MKNICLCLHIHQPVRLKKYRFFDSGKYSYQYDDIDHEKTIRKLADHYYLPMNEILLELLAKYSGWFRLAFSVSGTTIEQFSLFAPEVIESFQKMSAIGAVEFIIENNSHTYDVMKDEYEFKGQVEILSNKFEELFGKRPYAFINKELIYSDELMAIIAEIGFKVALTEGARQILKWKSPNYLYCNSINPELKILMKNRKLSDDLAFRFSNPDWTDRQTFETNYLSALNSVPANEKLINLFLDYEIIGRGQTKGSESFTFLKSFLATVFERTDWGFMTPSEIARHFLPVTSINVPTPMSRIIEEDHLKAWLCNELQQEEFGKIYRQNDKFIRCTNSDLPKESQYVKTCDQVYNNSGKHLPDVGLNDGINPYKKILAVHMN